jgi:hypothetical protein
MSDTTLDPTDQTELLRSLALERISPQWADFLGLMSEALSAQLDSGEYRQLLVGLGEGFAAQNPLPPCAGLNELTEAINAVWRRMQWVTRRYLTKVLCWRWYTARARCLLHCSWTQTLRAVFWKVFTACG